MVLAGLDRDGPVAARQPDFEASIRRRLLPGLEVFNVNPAGRADRSSPPRTPGASRPDRSNKDAHRDALA